MSEMEAHMGKLIPMEVKGDTLEEQAQGACFKMGFSIASYHKSWVDCLNDEGYRKVYILNNVIYKIDDTELDPFGFAHVNKNSDGTIDYFMNYYNGGASFNEALDGAIKEVSKE